MGHERRALLTLSQHISYNFTSVNSGPFMRINAEHFEHSSSILVIIAYWCIIGILVSSSAHFVCMNAGFLEHSSSRAHAAHDESLSLHACGRHAVEAGA